jgi:hypothetical protein
MVVCKLYPLPTIFGMDCGALYKYLIVVNHHHVALSLRWVAPGIACGTLVIVLTGLKLGWVAILARCALS